MDYYTAVLKKYAEFSGRARRAEYWMFALINLIVCAILYGVGLALGIGEGIEAVYGLAVLLPSLAVSARRLHDTGRSGWWLLVGAIPVIGWVPLVVFFLQDSVPEANRYGPNPKGV